MLPTLATSASAPVVPQAEDSESKKGSSLSAIDGLASCKGEDVQAAYVEQKERILWAIDDTKEILGSLRGFHKNIWVPRYPTFKDLAPTPVSRDQRPPGARRSLTFADDPHNETEVVISSPRRRSLKRSVTLASVYDESSGSRDVDDTTEPDTSDEPEDGLIPAGFNILRLDLKIGPHGSSCSPGALVSQLEKTSIANLIDQQIGNSIAHIDKLRLRIEDKSSKVLVTGDLNAGKSTFINALLGKDLMPVDQQPCTTMFCEVRDAGENNGLEEVHVVNKGGKYDISNESTYTRAAIAELEGTVTESDAERMCILYVRDAREPSQSLLHNGVVDIALIDAPGLNRDSLKTTALFARQEEIDVVVFVVSAENHFTLSAREFLWSASNEKAYLFIVVNKYDQIRDKAKCRRLVLDQIKQLSPRSWEDAEELVHFVDSDSALAHAAFPEGGPPKSSVPAESFAKLETSLRSFVLVKRAKSKLMPATTYLSNILSDIDLLASSNAIVAEQERDQAKADLERVRPVLEKMKRENTELEEQLAAVEDGTSFQAANRATTVLERALEKIGQGEIAVDADMVNDSSDVVIPTLPKYPGILHVWDYATDVRKTLLASMDLAVSLVEDDARSLTGEGVTRVSELGQTYLPDGVERSRRVFVPEAMFNPRRNRNGRHSAIVAGGVYGLGIGLSHRQDLVEANFQDVFDIHYRLLSCFDGGKEGARVDDESVSTLGIMSVGLGAVSVIGGGKVFGIRGVIEGIARICDIFSNERSRRWAVPALGIATAGLAVYLVFDLPTAIPRTVGRHIKASLAHPADDHISSPLVTPRLTFTMYHSERIQKETRKVIRIASWDLRDRFKTALENSQKEVKGAEEMEARASRAVAWFREVQGRTDAVREKADLASVF